MRLRKLGHGQSVMIIAPPEIDRTIRYEAGLRPEDKTKAKVVDVIRWTMLETCQEIMRYIPQWVEQGLDYEARYQAFVTSQRNWHKAEASELVCQARRNGYCRHLNLLTHIKSLCLK